MQDGFVIGPREMYKQAEGATGELKKNPALEKSEFNPKIAIVLGSGCGDVANSIDVIDRVPYRDIDGMPESTVKGHNGELIYGRLRCKDVLAFSGRNHFYEGISAQQASYMMYVAKHFGVEAVMMTSAAGIAPNPSTKPGDENRYPAKVNQVMLMATYEPNGLPSSIRGSVVEGLERFQATMNTPNIALGLISKSVARVGLKHLLEESKDFEDIIQLRNCVYKPRQGPFFETPAEVDELTELARITGLPVAGGMSIGPEIEAATYLGMATNVFIVITNKCHGMQDRDEIVNEVLTSFPDELVNEDGTLAYPLEVLERKVQEELKLRQPSHDLVTQVANSRSVTTKLESLIGGMVKAYHSNPIS